MEPDVHDLFQCVATQFFNKNETRANVLEILNTVVVVVPFTSFHSHVHTVVRGRFCELMLSLTRPSDVCVRLALAAATSKQASKQDTTAMVCFLAWGQD